MAAKNIVDEHSNDFHVKDIMFSDIEKIAGEFCDEYDWWNNDGTLPESIEQLEPYCQEMVVKKLRGKLLSMVMSKRHFTDFLKNTHTGREMLYYTKNMIGRKLMSEEEKEKERWTEKELCELDEIDKNEMRFDTREIMRG